VKYAALAVLGASLAAPVAAQAPAEGQDACHGVLSSPDRLGPAVAAVAQYDTTYVLVSREGGAPVTSLDAPALREVEVGVQAGTPAVALAAAAGLPRVREYPASGEAAGALVLDVLEGRMGAAVMWAPLAGLAAVQNDPENLLALRTLAEPHAPPAGLPSGGVGPQPCADAIKALLESYGVVPAEQTIRVEFGDLLDRRAPGSDRAAAEAGGAVFAERCARCHGAEVVAAPRALAPVNLIRSIRRFSYPGFLYVVLNGRPQNGHPAFRGTLEEATIASVYQYIRARSRGELRVTGIHP
jgi:mono/diheme cytochrome c family protein